ncbi:MAG: hypothetical protein J6W64_09100 [Bacilli bacterium]|nr:hypothetical protein [Bacilli bacterium]
MGKNSEMIDHINETTRLIIVGTFIPNIPFFYTGKNNQVYQRLDTRFNTHIFSMCKNNINKHLNNPRIYVDELIKRLSEIGVVFLDIIKKANVYDINGTKDENIEVAVKDNEMLNKLLEYQNNQNPERNIQIVAASGFAKIVLDNFGINCYYPNYGLVSGFNNANENWSEIFNEYLSDYTFED